MSLAEHPVIHEGELLAGGQLASTLVAGEAGYMEENGGISINPIWLSIFLYAGALSKRKWLPWQTFFQMSRQLSVAYC